VGSIVRGLGRVKGWWLGEKGSRWLVGGRDPARPRRAAPRGRRRLAC